MRAVKDTRFGPDRYNAILRYFTEWGPLHEGKRGSAGACAGQAPAARRCILPPVAPRLKCFRRLKRVTSNRVVVYRGRHLVLVKACCEDKAINSRQSRTANNFATCGDSRVPAVSSTTKRWRSTKRCTSTKVRIAEGVLLLLPTIRTGAWASRLHARSEWR